MENVYISVVIPLYNGADHIMKCIDNLDKQDCDFEYEVLVIDDCSSDNSAMLVEDHLTELQHPNLFQLIRSEKNGRAGSARNIGVRRARGHYILFIDQDDYPDTRMMRVLWENSQGGEVDLVSSAIKDRNGNIYYRPKLDGNNELTEEKRGKIIGLYGYVFASLIKRSVLVENSLFFPENVMFEDCLYNTGLVTCVKTIQTMEDVLYFREDDEKSQTAFFTSKKLMDRINATKYYLFQFQNIKQTRKYMGKTTTQCS